MCKTGRKLRSGSVMRGGDVVKGFVARTERPFNGKKVSRCDWNSAGDEMQKGYSMRTRWVEQPFLYSTGDEMQKGFPSFSHWDRNPFSGGTADAAAGGTRPGPRPTVLSWKGSSAWAAAARHSLRPCLFSGGPATGSGAAALLRAVSSRSCHAPCG